MLLLLQPYSRLCNQPALTTTATLPFHPAQLPGTQPVTSFSKPPALTFCLLFPGAPEAPYREQVQGAGRKAKGGTEAIGTRHLGRQGCGQEPQRPCRGAKLRLCPTARSPQRGLWDKDLSASGLFRLQPQETPSERTEGRQEGVGEPRERARGEAGHCSHNCSRLAGSL